MAEQLFCKQLVGGSIPFAGSIVMSQDIADTCLTTSRTTLGWPRGSSFQVSPPLKTATVTVESEKLPQMADVLQK